MAEERPDRVPPSDIRHRPLLSAAAAFAVGIVVARALPFPLWWPLLVGVLCAAFVAGLGARLGGGLRTSLVLVLVGAAGAANQAYRAGAAWTRAESSLARLLNTDATLCRITGTVDGEVTVARISPLIETIETSGDKPQEASTIRVRTQQAESNGRIAKISGDVSIVVKGELKDIGHGDRVSAFGWVVPLRPDRATDRYAVSQGIVARMSVPTPAAVQVIRRAPGSFFRFLYAAKQSFREQIDAHLAGDTATVLKAVLLGDRERLGGRLRASFNKSGTTHILAISGLHVGIVYGAIFWLCRMLLIQRWPRRAIVLSVVISYAVTTGLRPAAIRAVRV